MSLVIDVFKVSDAEHKGLCFVTLCLNFSLAIRASVKVIKTFLNFFEMNDGVKYKDLEVPQA